MTDEQDDDDVWNCEACDKSEVSPTGDEHPPIGWFEITIARVVAESESEEDTKAVCSIACMHKVVDWWKEDAVPG